MSQEHSRYVDNISTGFVAPRRIKRVEEMREMLTQRRVSPSQGEKAQSLARDPGEKVIVLTDSLREQIRRNHDEQAFRGGVEYIRFCRTYSIMDVLQHLVEDDALDLSWSIPVDEALPPEVVADFEKAFGADVQDTQAMMHSGKEQAAAEIFQSLGGEISDVPAVLSYAEAHQRGYRATTYNDEISYRFGTGLGGVEVVYTYTGNSEVSPETQYPTRSIVVRPV